MTMVQSAYVQNRRLHKGELPTDTHTQEKGAHPNHRPNERLTEAKAGGPTRAQCTGSTHASGKTVASKDGESGESDGQTEEAARWGRRRQLKKGTGIEVHPARPIFSEQCLFHTLQEGVHCSLGQGGRAQEGETCGNVMMEDGEGEERTGPQYGLSSLPSCTPSNGD